MCFKAYKSPYYRPSLGRFIIRLKKKIIPEGHLQYAVHDLTVLVLFGKLFILYCVNYIKTAELSFGESDHAVKLLFWKNANPRGLLCCQIYEQQLQLFEVSKVAVTTVYQIIYQDFILHPFLHCIFHFVHFLRLTVINQLLLGESHLSNMFGVVTSF